MCHKVSDLPALVAEAEGFIRKLKAQPRYPLSSKETSYRTRDTRSTYYHTSDKTCGEHQITCNLYTSRNSVCGVERPRLFSATRLPCILRTRHPAIHRTRPSSPRCNDILCFHTGVEGISTGPQLKSVIRFLFFAIAMKEGAEGGERERIQGLRPNNLHAAATEIATAEMSGHHITNP